MLSYPLLLPSLPPRILSAILLFMLWIGYPPPVQGGKVIEASVEYADGRFTLHTDILIRVPAPQVRAILTQFENLPNVNRGIKAVEILSRTTEDQIRMKIQSEVCILFICLDYNWVQEVHMLPTGDIITYIDPTASDFREGWVRYRILAQNQQTRLLMDAKLVPDFWFPPLIGPLIIKRKLRDEALETALGVERLANHKSLPIEYDDALTGKSQRTP